MCLFPFGPPTQTLTHLGAQGAILAFAKINYILHIKGYLHTEYFDTSAFLIWRKGILQFAQFLSLGALHPPGPHARYEKLWVPSPRDDPYQIWLKSTHWFWIWWWKWAQRAILAFAKNKLYFSYINISTHKTFRHNWLWVWRRRVLKFAIFLHFGVQPQGPLGSTCPTCWTTLGSYPLRIILTKFDCNLVIGSGDDNENVFFPLAPPPQVWTPLGAQGGYPSICHQQTILFIYIKVSSYKILWL